LYKLKVFDSIAHKNNENQSKEYADFMNEVSEWIPTIKKITYAFYDDHGWRFIFIYEE
jgi:hypothetical protein